MEENLKYSFWLVWVKTTEGLTQWHIGRFPADATEDDVHNRVWDNDSVASIVSIEHGFDDGNWHDYVDISQYESCNHEFISREYQSQPYGTCLGCGKTMF